ncbi:MAG: hypothetical protein IT168_19185 [Bryobacterales bacterium]|nr:hypothetical protein [Bryobacterales bacterium]
MSIQTLQRQVGFDVTWLKEGFKAALEGHINQPLEADLTRTITIDDRGMAGPLRNVFVTVHGDDLSPALAKLLLESPFPGPLLQRVQDDVHRVLNAAIAQRVRQLIALGQPLQDGEIRIPLHLPFLNRFLVREWTGGNGGCQFTIGDGGRILSQDRDIYQTVALFAGASVNAVDENVEIPITFVHTSELDPALARLRLPPIFEAYGFDARWVRDVEWEGPIRVHWSLSVPGASTIAWLALPDERSEEFFDFVSEASIGLQRALRTWIPYHVMDPKKFSYDAGHALLAYAVLRPFRSSKSKQYVRDILDLESVRRSLRHIKRKLAHRMLAVGQYLDEREDPELKRWYVPQLTDRILGNMNRMPKHFGGLLAGESHLVDEIIGIAGLGRKVAKALDSTPPQPICNLWRDGGKFHHEIQLRLRRAWPSAEATSLVSLILVEATRAMAEARKLPTPLSVFLRIEDLATGNDLIGANQYRIGRTDPGQVQPTDDSGASSDDESPLDTTWEQ